MVKQTKVLTRRKKFIKVNIPFIKQEIELLGISPKDVENKTIKLDLTRQLKGKSIEATVKVKIENEKPVTHPVKLRLMPYFIRRMIRKRVSYVEDSFETPSQESLLKVKPFFITRKRVSRAVRKTLRNKAKNWIEDYLRTKKDEEIFNEIVTNKIQKPLSLNLKKTYPLSLCEIKVLEIKIPLKPEEIPKEEIQEPEKKSELKDELEKIENQKIKEAEQDIKETQKKALEKDNKKD
ncbi:hypothetical protein GF386_01640 [Candidatus Pacearchaeota archaeon]|nr:hypothetical protein [Candidatus Pacearchaeota archaeon]MBD3282882.1 hypothetical protein [Candidatus Pacearchaeota archaeon]